jgi:hypothetical protein
MLIMVMFPHWNLVSCKRAAVGADSSNGGSS